MAATKVVGPSHKSKCPYMVRPCKKFKLNLIEERFDFEIQENGKIGRKSLGQFDLVKEVNSHNGEVGLINCLKLAQARGIDPSTFAKTEPGLMVDLTDIETVDDLINKQKSTNAKLEEIAKQAGLSVDDLVAMVQSGDFSKLTQEEGGADDVTTTQE